MKDKHDVPKSSYLLSDESKLCQVSMTLCVLGLHEDQNHCCNCSKLCSTVCTRIHACMHE